MNYNFFRELLPNEENDFKNWARENYVPNSKINSVWHPVVQEECKKINRESAINDAIILNHISDSND